MPLGNGDPPEGRGGPLVLGPGRYSIRIETEEVDGRLMALLHVEENMTDDSGTLESLLSGAGLVVAAGMILLVIFILYRSTGPANAAIALQTAAAEVCGDIGTVAASAVPCASDGICSPPGITIRITSDYVVAGDSPPDREFARPLAVRVYPGSYAGQEGEGWNDTTGLRRYFNATFGQPGTKESPWTSPAAARLRRCWTGRAGIWTALLCSWTSSGQLTIEKLFVYTHNATSGMAESEPYVFVYRR